MSCRPPTRPGLPRQAPPQVDGALQPAFGFALRPTTGSSRDEGALRALCLVLCSPTAGCQTRPAAERSCESRGLGEVQHCRNLHQGHMGVDQQLSCDLKPNFIGEGLETRSLRLQTTVQCAAMN